MAIRTIRQIKNLNNQTIFLRVDFNVPIKKGKVLEDFKIRQSLEDIDYLLEHGSKLIIATHLGSPKGKIVQDLSTKPIANLLSKVIKKPIKFLDVSKIKDFPTAKKLIAKMKPGQIAFLENLRFNKGEQSDDLKWAKNLADLADVYVNNAFAVCHRSDASVSAIKKFLPSFAGLLLEQEIINLNKVLHPKKPLVILIGGAKIETKTTLIKNLFKSASQILVGGALANSFLAAKGYSVGSSLTDRESIKVAKTLLQKNRSSLAGGSKIILPVDVITSTKLTKDHQIGLHNIIRIRQSGELGPNEYICDIGPETIGLFSKYIKKAQTIVWNGPMGLFETPSFRQGTVIMARLIASRAGGRAYGVIGGGETIEALNLSKMAEYMDWVSTGGGAMLAYLGGEKLPGLKGIIK
ncbi:phosphoglycerate kinase [Candidatus Falkowbacteria bacterium CG_4_10_14_0_2_um_filter_41_15]|uniref:Phosphoglycerate kinase n=4 Tax=Candidatus Falkowiibacteriota TaxID=1752728 RepID=A0A2G9ZPT2_9BACT|nr:MAG: phosphoglycerate kinase [Candidatus Falkowbacteria bacterium CG1_02_41_21]PIP34358.1 MAG: phosphoglycerate kinase [Candidatus Falkowbacteria bacterium CG23_combo_of_CG06-09_8_20_14_all_41_10]PIZ09673.1 MAG: phosphoglycerate kinase [Candidatus Falkowbacteria bacterium CG_4_10_14_0_8_um_filter_41_36]PJA08734.1 MAG: phosphoglycerate kinase [Candidatus Falkowbacteria bacterium CG_4_10_14_0_2_um_filter_41_15]